MRIEQASANPYGDPLAPKGSPARYHFWPEKAKVWPLLFFCAERLLCAKATSLENERVHSASGRFMSKLRSRMKPAKLEQLTVTYKKLRDIIGSPSTLVAVDIGNGVEFKPLSTIEDGEYDGDVAEPEDSVV